jgi:C-terminal processing protease CtpA/Prc
VGERSFGKGTIQGIFNADLFLNHSQGKFTEGESKQLSMVQKFELQNNAKDILKSYPFLVSGISFKMTTARFYLPSKTSNQIIGITPDFDTPMRSNATAEDRYALREEDLYTNPLSAISGPRTVSAQKKNEISLVNSCLKQGQAKKAEAALLLQNRKQDYQLLVGQEVLNCARAKGVSSVQVRLR